jgi:hypothetical protein
MATRTGQHGRRRLCFGRIFADSNDFLRTDFWEWASPRLTRMEMRNDISFLLCFFSFFLFFLCFPVFVLLSWLASRRLFESSLPARPDDRFVVFSHTSCACISPSSATRVGSRFAAPQLDRNMMSQRNILQNMTMQSRGPLIRCCASAIEHSTNAGRRRRGSARDGGRRSFFAAPGVGRDSNSSWSNSRSSSNSGLEDLSPRSLIISPEDDDDYLREFTSTREVANRSITRGSSCGTAKADTSRISLRSLPPQNGSHRISVRREPAKKLENVVTVVREFASPLCSPPESSSEDLHNDGSKRKKKNKKRSRSLPTNPTREMATTTTIATPVTTRD